jgi:Ca-activated chloride channel family protein
MPMPKPWLRVLWLLCGLVTIASGAAFSAPQGSVATFRSRINFVSITAVVRDRQGRSVRSLAPGDFRVTDAGEARAIVDLRTEASAPASIALLVDGSGSMRLGGADTASLRISEAILDSLDARRDEAALFSFDRRLITLQDFTRDLGAVRGSLRHVESWGSTSLFDAIGGTAGIVATKTQNRRAVIVLTDGADNASAYTSDEIAAAASAIDVPVYVFAVGATLGETIRVDAPLAELARLTGGAFFRAHDAVSEAAAIRVLVEELRHQYVLSFESVAENGWHAVEVTMRDRTLRVRTRRYYHAAPSE